MPTGKCISGANRRAWLPQPDLGDRRADVSRVQRGPMTRRPFARVPRPGQCASCQSVMAARLSLKGASPTHDRGCRNRGHALRPPRHAVELLVIVLAGLLAGCGVRGSATTADQAAVDACSSFRSAVQDAQTGQPAWAINNLIDTMRARGSASANPDIRTEAKNQPDLSAQPDVAADELNTTETLWNNDCSKIGQ